jgi:hypothetical protein
LFCSGWGAVAANTREVLGNAELCRVAKSRTRTYDTIRAVAALEVLMSLTASWLLVVFMLLESSSSFAVEARLPQGRGQDHSPAPADYMQRGLPAIDRPWSAPDYQAALRIFAALPIEQLPRTSSAQSAAVINRLTDPANLGVLMNRSLPLNVRFPGAMDLVDAANAITKIYLAAASKDTALVEDLVRLLGFMLQAATTEAALIDEFLPTLNKSDPTYPTRMAGLAQSTMGFAQTVQGTLLTLRDPRGYSRTSRVRLAKIVVSVWPRMVSHLPPLSAREFLGMLQKLADSDADPEIRRVLKTMPGIE